MALYITPPPGLTSNLNTNKPHARPNLGIEEPRRTQKKGDRVPKEKPLLISHITTYPQWVPRRQHRASGKSREFTEGFINPKTEEQPQTRENSQSCECTRSRGFRKHILEILQFLAEAAFAEFVSLLEGDHRVGILEAICSLFRHLYRTP